jgi:hypothetical protein
MRRHGYPQRLDTEFDRQDEEFHRRADALMEKFIQLRIDVAILAHDHAKTIAVLDELKAQETARLAAKSATPSTG